VADVLFSLMQRFLDDTDYVQVVGADGVERLQPISGAAIAGDYALEFKADSSDRVDSEARVQRALKAYNLLANSQTTNRANLEHEIWDALGFDPDRMMVKPNPPKPEPPNISLRVAGEDLANPMVVALLLQNGYDLGQDAIKAAQMLIRDSVVGMQQTVQDPNMTAAAGGPAPPAAPQGLPPVTPPTTNEPILKRGVSGERFV
jgi:hypothetical protein